MSNPISAFWHRWASRCTAPAGGATPATPPPAGGKCRLSPRQSMDQYLPLLADARVDVIAYGCTSATLSDGPEFDRQFCEELTQKSGRPAFTTAGALIEAIRSIGAERVAFTSPYV